MDVIVVEMPQVQICRLSKGDATVMPLPCGVQGLIVDSSGYLRGVISGLRDLSVFRDGRWFEAADRSAAHQLLRLARIDVVLVNAEELDVNLGNLVEAIVADSHQTLPTIVAVTNDGRDQRVQSLLNAGVDCVLMKTASHLLQAEIRTLMVELFGTRRL